MRLRYGSPRSNILKVDCSCGRANERQAGASRWLRSREGRMQLGKAFSVTSDTETVWQTLLDVEAIAAAGDRVGSGARDRAGITGAG